MPVTPPRARASPAAGCSVRPAPSLKVAAALAPGIAYAPKADRHAGRLHHLRPGTVRRPVLRQEGRLPHQGRPRRGVQGATSSRARTQAWEAVVDGTTGRCSTAPASSSTTRPAGTVYDNYPGAARAGSRGSSRSGPPPQSPKGWVDPTGAHRHRRDDARQQRRHVRQLVELPRARRQRAAPGHPDRPLQLRRTPTSGQPRRARPCRRPTPQDLNPAATNLFFQHNRIHDEYYALGFTETAGNFQLDNGRQRRQRRRRDPRPRPGRRRLGRLPDLHRSRQRLHAHPATTASRRGAACSCGSRSTTRSRAPTATASFDMPRHPARVHPRPVEPLRRRAAAPSARSRPARWARAGPTGTPSTTASTPGCSPSRSSATTSPATRPAASATGTTTRTRPRSATSATTSPVPRCTPTARSGPRRCGTCARRSSPATAPPRAPRSRPARSPTACR